MPNLADHLPYLTRLELKHRASLLQKANVCGVVKGYKRRKNLSTDIPSLVILVTKKLAPLQLQAADLIPAMIDNMPTDVVEVGVIRALNYRTERQRPCKGGISVGHHPLVTAGTLTSWFNVDGVNWAMSNNHVLAASNQAKKGDPIVQPGRHDEGTCPADTIATLDRFVPIKFIEQNSCPIARGVAGVFNLPLKGLRRKGRFIVRQEVMNRVDCALAKEDGFNIVDDEVYELGVLKGWRKLQVGDEIRKSGRTTDVTTGTIDYIGTIQVSYGSAGVAFFEEQFVSLSMLCAGGDSGSPVDDRHLYLGGLLFAGSDTSTIINQIEYVWNELNFHPLAEVT